MHRGQNYSRGMRNTLAFEALENRTLLSVAAGTSWDAFGVSAGPSVVITIGQNGVISLSNSGFGPFDGIEDTYIGVVNNSGFSVPNLRISAASSSDIIGFDEDGIQSY